MSSPTVDQPDPANALILTKKAYRVPWLLLLALAIYWSIDYGLYLIFHNKPHHDHWRDHVVYALGHESVGAGTAASLIQFENKGRAGYNHQFKSNGACRSVQVTYFGGDGNSRSLRCLILRGNREFEEVFAFWNGTVVDYSVKPVMPRSQRQAR